MNNKEKKNVILFYMSTRPILREEKSKKRFELTKLFKTKKEDQIKSPNYDNSKYDFTYVGKDYFEKTEIKKCISQLEPVTRLILENRKNDKKTEMVMLCTAATLVPNNGKDFFEERIGKKFKNVEFTVIEDKNNTLDTVNKAVEKIREIEKEHEIELYIAANGGLRDSFETLSIIISMLKHEDIYPEGIYSTETQNHTIYDFEAAKYVEFANAINEFIEFGSVINFERYFINKFSKIEIDKDELYLCMKKISDSIQLCNVYNYTDGIKELREIVEKDESKVESTIFSTKEFNLFKEIIKENYGSNKDDSVLPIIEVCMKKHMYNQALALIESKMPEELHKKGILYLDNDNDLKRIMKTFVPKDPDAIDYTNENNVVYKCWNELLKSMIKKFPIENAENAKFLIEHLNNYIKGIKVENENKKIIEHINNNEYFKKEYAKIKEKNTNVKPEYTSLRQSLLILLRMIKNQRNNIFHVDGEKMWEMKDVNDAIDAFLKTYKFLIDKTDKNKQPLSGEKIYAIYKKVKEEVNKTKQETKVV